jgi:DNA-binding MarR family transcriptional regulator
MLPNRSKRQKKMSDNHVMNSLSPMRGAIGMVGTLNSNARKAVVIDTESRHNISVIRNTMLEMVRKDGRDLTARQLTALLSVYLKDETQTVTSLANMLNVSRPGVTRILDRLVDAELVSRAEDKQDRRRVLIRRTREGARFVQTLAEMAGKAGDTVQ